LEKVAALLRSRQFQRFRKIGKNAPKTWRDLSDFCCIGPDLPTEVIQTRCLRQIAFDDLGEREVGKRFVSFVAAPDGAPEASAGGILRHLHRQAGLTYTGSIPEHDNRSVARSRTIGDRANRATFRFSPHERSSFRQQKRRNPEHRRRCMRMIGMRGSGNATCGWLLCRLDSRTRVCRSEFPRNRRDRVRLVGAEGPGPDASREDIPHRRIAARDSFQYRLDRLGDALPGSV
jgi:hypothetical protein